MYSCHKIPSDFYGGQIERSAAKHGGNGYIVSSFRRVLSPVNETHDTKFVLFRTGEAGHPTTTTLDLEQLLNVIFHPDDATPRQLDFWSGIQSLQQVMFYS